MIFFFFIGVPAKPFQVCWLYFVFCFCFYFFFNIFPLENNWKFLFFPTSSKSLRNSETLLTKILLILMVSAIESLTSSISLLMMANRAYCAFCLHNNSFSLRNCSNLCREHLTDFNRLFVIANDCCKRL